MKIHNYREHIHTRASSLTSPGPIRRHLLIDWLCFSLLISDGPIWGRHFFRRAYSYSTNPTCDETRHYYVVSYRYFTLSMLRRVSVTIGGNCES